MVNLNVECNVAVLNVTLIRCVTVRVDEETCRQPAEVIRLLCVRVFNKECSRVLFVDFIAVELEVCGCAARSKLTELEVDNLVNRVARCNGNFERCALLFAAC